MGDQLVIFDKGALVEEKLDPLPGRELVTLVLLVNPGLTAAHESLLLDVVQSLHKCLRLA